jgi:glycosyltransferase involved in cell wall biosynthesis
MRIAFHAPLKPPDHPVPSGDRTMARLLIQALRMGGHEVFLASRLRTREGKGDRKAQKHLRALAQQEATMLVARLLEDPPDIWFTYHLYYKAPDLIGPLVTRTLGIPYVAAEASHADKRMQGPHASFAADALKAIRQANAIICLTKRDREALEQVATPGTLHDLKPFVQVRPAPGEAHSTGPVRLLTVAMMRPGDKLQSFRLLARSLMSLGNLDWRLTIVGGGEAERSVRAAFAPVSDRVDFAGVVSGPMLDRIYEAHDIYVWPAVNEAYGLSLLQASAHGLPVIAGAEGGVPEIIRHGESGLLVRPRDPASFTLALGQLFRDTQLRQRLHQGSWRRVERFHGISAAASALNRIILPLCRS